MRRLILTYLVCFLSSLISAMAFSANQCSSLSSKKDFAISFSISNAQLKEAVWSTKKNSNRNYLLLWSNDDDLTPAIFDEQTKAGNDYEVMLFYTAGAKNSRQGTLEYYLKTNDISPNGWYYIDSATVRFAKNNIQIDGDNVDSLACFDKAIPDKPIPPAVTFPDRCDVYPAEVQTWQGNNGSDLLGIYGNSGIYLRSNFLSIPSVGYLPASIGWGASQDGCRGESCVSNADYIINKYDVGGADDFRRPTDVDYESISIVDDDIKFSSIEAFGRVSITRSTVTLKSGEYWFDSLDINSQSDIVIPNGENVIIHSKAISLSGNSFIDGDGRLMIIIHDLPFRFPVAGHSNFNISGQSYVWGDIYSEKSIDVNRSTIVGSVTSKSLQLTTSSYVFGQLATGCDPTPTDPIKLEVTPPKEFALLCESPVITFTVRNDNDNEIITDYDGVMTLSLPNSLSVKEVITGSVQASDYKTEQGVLAVALDSTDYGQFAIQGQLDSGESGSSELYVAPYKFAIDTVSSIAARDEPMAIRALACDDGSPEPVTSYNGNKTLSIFNQTLENPTENQGAVWGALDIKNQSGASSSTTQTFQFTDGVASGKVNYSESGAISFTLKDASFSCPSGFDCELTPTESWSGLEGIVNINSRPWTFAICEPNGADMTGTSKEGKGFKAAGETFSLKVMPIVYQSGGAISGDIDVSSYCNATVTNNFFVDQAPPATIELKGVLATPSSGVIGTGSDLVTLPEGETLMHTENIANSDYYLFSNMYWNEVGSLKVIADIGGRDYLDSTVNSGYRNVGRFYPDHLTLLNSIDSSNEIWEYAFGHDDFAYMGQPITHQFTVQAEAYNRNDVVSVTKNYGLFDEDYVVTMDYLAIAQTGLNNAWQMVDSGSNQRVENGESYRWDSNDWGDTTGQMTFTDNNFIFIKQRDTTQVNYSSVVDGPFGKNAIQKALFGVVVTDSVDDVDFVNLDFGDELAENTSHVGRQFDEQPDFRYGRMALSDVGGNQATEISVPLRTEYWNGSLFQVNSDDDASQFNADSYCYESIWSEGSSTSNVKINPSGNKFVESGTNNDLYAQQVISRREQVRLWLRQQATIPNGLDSGDCDSAGTSIDQPWLRYNWRDVGDEDPSAVITFGIFRGNDRVIFRAESGLFGQ